MKWKAKDSLSAALGLAVMVYVSGCYKWDMVDQAKQKPLSASPMFKDGRSSRPPVEGTVARGQLFEDEHLYLGKVNGSFATQFPYPVSDKMLAVGRTKYNVFCAPCHDRVGTGHGMIVQRGYGVPPTYHQKRLRDETPGYFYDVITNGIRTMPAYGAQVRVKDRWAIVAYIKALQLSQNVPATELTAEEKALVTESTNPKPKTEKESNHE